MKTEFDTRQTQANAAVKLLSKQYDDFNVKISALDNDIKAVQNIENQINSYAQVLNDLNDMTDKVEENLRRIQKESNVVDSISSKLLKQQQVVENIDKRIPQVSENFAKVNAEQLKGVGYDLLEKYKAYATSIADNIHKSQDGAEEALEKIRQEVQAAFDSADMGKGVFAQK